MTLWDNTNHQHYNNDNNYNDDNVWFEFSIGYFNDNIHDIRKGNVTRRSGIQTKNIHTLAFWGIREGATLRRLILRSLDCIPPRVRNQSSILGLILSMKESLRRAYTKNFS